MLMLRIFIVPDERYIKKQIPNVKHRYVYLRNNLPKILDPIFKNKIKQVECEIWEFELKEVMVDGKPFQAHTVIPGTMTSYSFSYIKEKLIKGFKTHHQTYNLM